MAARGKHQGARTTSTKTHRYQQLRELLEERRRRIVGEMQDRIRHVRTEGSRALEDGVRDETESSEAEIQDDLEFALLQMKAETLRLIDQALERLEGGTYGSCNECGEGIAEPRLRALPFAVRCKACEEIREAERLRERASTQRRGAGSPFAEPGG
ncbi:MAG: TraR/DksA C4-type zinc finger protein [Acidobacteria bacterium]|nr:TraR/DksA C4-type zinc finger protein [Acidobacteriota bacterium]